MSNSLNQSKHLITLSENPMISVNEIPMRRFRAQTGYTIHAYLVGKRLMLAREKISAGVPVMEAACQCGFGDYSSFSRAYRREFGHAPSSAR